MEKINQKINQIKPLIPRANGLMKIMLKITGKTRGDNLPKCIVGSI